MAVPQTGLPFRVKEPLLYKMILLGRTAPCLEAPPHLGDVQVRLLVPTNAAHSTSPCGPDAMQSGMVRRGSLPDIRIPTPAVLAELPLYSHPSGQILHGCARAGQGAAYTSLYRSMSP